MTEEDKRNKNLVLIEFLQNNIEDYKIKAEYSTNDKDTKVIVVQETSGNKVVFFGSNNPLYNYFNIEIFGDNIQDAYHIAGRLGDLIGHTIYYDRVVDGNIYHWQLIFKQYTNPRTIEYYDIRRVSYSLTLQCVVNMIGNEIE